MGERNESITHIVEIGLAVEILRHLPYAVLVLTPEGEIVEWLGGAEAIFGYTPQQALGMPVTALCRPKTCNDLVARIQVELRHTNYFQIEIKGLRQDGSALPIELSAHNLNGPQPGPSRLLVTLRDITMRKQREAALRENEERLRLALEAGQMGTWDWNIKTGVVRWSANLDTLYGPHQDAAKTTYGEFTKIVHRDDIPAVTAGIERAFRNRGPYEMEFRANWPDGTVRSVLSKGEVFSDEAGFPVRLVGIGMDITERKQLEEKLLQAHKLESVGLLAGGVAHDFNNLLTGVMGNASLAALEIPADSPAQPLLEDVISASERAAELTRQLLAYSGKANFRVQAVDLCGLIRETLGLIKLSIPKKARLVLALNEDIPALQGDRTQVQQIIMNLVINGAEALDHAGGDVVIRTGTCHLDPADVHEHFAHDELRRGDFVYLEVEDHGSGMDAATVARIFDPFFTTKFTGRGLGLAAVSGIVRGHHGSISVKSEPEKGSIFRVFFPSGGGAETPIQKSRHFGSLAGKGTVLVVDDEEIIRRMAQSALKRCGYKVLLAEDGENALEVISALGNDLGLVILDMNMPVLDGEDALQEIRQIAPDLPVLASSGDSEQEAARRFHGAAISGFIQKPYSAEVLAARVKAAIRAPQSKP